MKRLAGPLVTLALLWLPRAAMAQCSGASCTVTIQLPVNTIVRMTLTSVATPLGNPTAADFTAGYKDANGPSVTVKANRAYHVDVAAATPTFGLSAKPASDLLWGTSPGTYGHNAGTSSTLTSGGATAGSVAVPIYYRTLWSFAGDPPGTYMLTLQFTVAAP